MKFYTIVGCIIVVITIIIISFIYVIKNERKLSNYQKEIQAQQITMETNQMFKKKQKEVLHENTILQKQQQMIDYSINMQKKQAIKKLENADELNEKQKLLNDLFD